MDFLKRMHCIVHFYTNGTPPRCHHHLPNPNSIYNKGNHLFCPFMPIEQQKVAFSKALGGARKQVNHTLSRPTERNLNYTAAFHEPCTAHPYPAKGEINRGEVRVHHP